MSAERIYKNEAQSRGYKVLLLLAGNEFNGVAPGELAKAINTSAGNVTRDLRILQEAGLAEPLPHDPKRWRLGPKIVQIANSFKSHIAEVQRRAAEVEQRYTRSTY